MACVVRKNLAFSNSWGATGYSATRVEGHFPGMELHSLDWTVAPLDIESAESSFFDDLERFPAGSIEADCALIMRGIRHEWRSRPDLFLSAEGSKLTRKNGK